jgi:hypothetical protein
LKPFVPIRSREAGQATVFVLLASSIFLIGGIGLALDASHLYAQRQMAQAAADAAAQAGIMSIYDGTSLAWGAHTANSAFTCGSSDTAISCQYAKMNGFDPASDKVTVTPNPATVSVPNLSTSDSVNLLQVKIQRTVPTTFMKLLGPSATAISASGTAAIVAVSSPVPIVVTHPSDPQVVSTGSGSITICGGPQQSIQVNSSNRSAFTGGNIDLSKAGPSDSGSCTTGTGGDFGVFGGQTSQPGSLLLGAKGRYISPSSPIQDPLAGIYPDRAGYTNGGPPVPTQTGKSQSCTVLGHCGSCPGGVSSCTEYLPGLWTGSLSPGGVAMFDPGLYYVRGGGFSLKNVTVGMCTSCAADTLYGTANGMVVYDTGTTSKPTQTGGFSIDTNVDGTLLGGGILSATSTAAPLGPYYGILFFEDRHADTKIHSMGQGNGCWSLIGTIYLNNKLDIMQNDSTHYQSISYGGNPCSSTSNQGEIITGKISMNGSKSAITMSLFPGSFLSVRKVALVQ